MEIPLLSGLLKRFRKQQLLRRLEHKRRLAIVDGWVAGLLFDKKTEKFICNCCKFQMCGRKGNGYLVAEAIKHQERYDHIQQRVIEAQ